MASAFKKSLMLPAMPALFVTVSGAWAQDAGPVSPAASADDEIVVTAQKREQRLIDVPMAVTAVTADSLVDQNLVTLRDFATRIPGLQISAGGVQSIALRGVTTGGNTNPTVAILIDDVQFGSSTYLGQPPIPDLDPGTLQRVEVLRGPQGTLYGASSLGGLIKYVTRDPDATAWSGRAEAGIASVADGGTGWSARGSLNAPIIADRVALSISGFYRDDPRYIDSTLGTVTVKDANKVQVWGGRAALMVKPFDALTIVGSALIQRRDSAGDTLIPVCTSCVAPSTSPVVFNPRGVADLRTAAAAVVPSDADLELYTARATLDLDKVQLVSISAWGRSALNTAQDVSAVFAAPLNSVYGAGGVYLLSAPTITHKFSQELRLSGAGSDAEWLIGGFYTNERSTLAQLVNRTGAAPSVTAYNGSNISTYEEKAVFGDVTFHAGSQFDFQIGARYATNKQTYNVVSTIDPAAVPIFGPSSSRVFNSDEDSFTWVVTPTYRFSRDAMVFARIASGYRPGGPNTQLSGVAPTFGPDTVLNYELGFKGQFADRRITIDTSIFQIDWRDIQLQNTALPSNFVFFENGKKARSRGIEFATSIRPWTGMVIDGNATLLDAVLTQSFDRSTSTTQRLRGVAGDRLPYSAKFSGNIGAQQTVPLGGDLEGTFGFNVSHVGSRLAFFNTDAAAARIPRVRVPAYTLVDLNANITIGRMWKLNAYVRNLFDEMGVTNVDTRNGVNLPRATFTQPRTIGLTASVNF
ncbi:TonB-dependent receptor [Sphingomonas sp. MG17]|uniref:TonB-dependent receptor n=1 Tax=Sphingomonas tagetis TaxID=2949092 RepID=A0A9X2HN47_9SPHN|nr:TonB-dependent receptor [Sphingomonas tagetis]MCP3732727.1 TonB-dependent receptor [Sphingomonas tagetis]